MSFFSFKKTAVGIDIFDEAIEIVVIQKKGSDINLLSKCRAVMDPGLVTYGAVSDKQKLIDVLTGLLKKNDINLADHDFVAFGLPDSQSYIHSFLTENVNDDEYADLVLNELVKIVPIPESNLAYGYVVATETDDLKKTSKVEKNKSNIISVGADKNVVYGWQDIFSSLGVKNVIIIPEKATTEIGLSFTKKTKNSSTASESKYIESVGLAVSVLDQKKYKVPFIKEMISKPIVSNIVSSDQVLIEEPKVEEADMYSEGEKTVIDNTDEEKKIKKQKLTLLVISIFGLIVITSLFFYESSQEQKRQAEIAARRTNFSVVQTFNLDIPVAVDGEGVDLGRIKGRLFIDSFTTLADQDEATAFSKIRAGQNLSVSDELWLEPLSVSVNNGKVVKNKNLEKKYTITWFIYDDKETNILTSNKVSQAFEPLGIKFAVNNIEKKTVRPSDNPQIYLLTVLVSVSLENNIEGVIIQ